MSTQQYQRSLGPMEVQKVESPVSTALKPLESFRELFGRTLGQIGWSQKRAALEMGITEAQFSRQLRGQEHLSLWRCHGLPKEFWQEFIVLLADFYAISVSGSPQQQADAEVGRTIRELVQRVQR